jgi:hypothetical protein
MKTPWWFWSIIAGFLIGLALYGDATAHADPIEPNIAIYAAAAAPVICEAFDEHPTIIGVTVIAEAIIDNGFTGHQAGQIIAIAVESNCPRHIPLLRQFVEAVTTPATGALA